MGNITISLMEKNEAKQAAKVLSLAMLDNPLHQAVFLGSGEQERLEIEAMFDDLLTQRPGIVFLAKEERDIVGVMRMNSCSGRDLPDGPPEFDGKTDIRWRKFVWLREWALQDPKEQHWHLGPIGVLPSHRRLGIGSRLMDRFCNEVDACAARAYLETDRDENVLFYELFGFEVIATSQVFDVENRYMLREARP